MTAASSYDFVEEYLDTLLRLGRPTDPHDITEDDIYDLFATLRVAESSKESGVVFTSTLRRSMSACSSTAPGLTAGG